ncbi:hypothetical protein EVAR_33229_1 [Eumeta japonica]|uniref:Uncharacterized protein n=1 Tax=Eumeta variegata TaxID=151549 RepID=A0A4C1W4M5_EUMVA|nr:hypothetical protein EVAR_33229_1 [Eumeta japonica]
MQFSKFTRSDRSTYPIVDFMNRYLIGVHKFEPNERVLLRARARCTRVGARRQFRGDHLCVPRIEDIIRRHVTGELIESCLSPPATPSPRAPSRRYRCVLILSLHGTKGERGREDYGRRQGEGAKAEERVRQRCTKEEGPKSPPNAALTLLQRMRSLADRPPAYRKWRGRYSTKISQQHFAVHRE